MLRSVVDIQPLSHLGAYTGRDTKMPFSGELRQGVWAPARVVVVIGTVAPDARVQR